MAVASIAGAAKKGRASLPAPDSKAVAAGRLRRITSPAVP